MVYPNIVYLKTSVNLEPVTLNMIIIAFFNSVYSFINMRYKGTRQKQISLASKFNKCLRLILRLLTVLNKQSGIPCHN